MVPPSVLLSYPAAKQVHSHHLCRLHPGVALVAQVPVEFAALYQNPLLRRFRQNFHASEDVQESEGLLTT